MNRNVQILALTGCVAAALAVAWWATSDPGRPERSESPHALEEPARAEEPKALALDREDPVPEVALTSSPGAVRQVAADPRPEPLAWARLVSGRVVDENQRPVSGARVVVTEIAAAGKPLDSGAVVATIWSDAEGRYEIRATVPSLHLVAHASKAGYVDSSPAEFQRGAEGLRLVLLSGGVVSGRLLLDPWVSLDRITMEIASPGLRKSKASAFRDFARSRALEGVSPSARSEPDSNLFRIDDEGRFAVGGFAGPTVTVSITAADDPGQVFEVEDVLVQKPGDPPDARLDPIDLRRRFARLGVDVIDDAGVKRDGARVALRPGGRTDGERAQFTRDGRAEFLVWAGPHDLDVALQGFRSVRLSAIEGDQIVQLRKGIQVRVRLRGIAARPPPPDLLAIALLKGTRIHPILDGIGAFQDPLRTTFVVASPGPHEIGWYLERGSIQAYLETGGTQTVDVRDQDGVQDIVIDLPASVESAWNDRLKEFDRIAQEQRDGAVRGDAQHREFERVLRDREGELGREDAPEPK